MGKRPSTPPTSAANPAAPAQSSDHPLAPAAPFAPARLPSQTPLASVAPPPSPAAITATVGGAPSAPSEASLRRAADDRRLIESIRAGSPSAWKDLLLAHQDRLFGLCIHMVGQQHAEDIAQEALLRIIRGLPEFDGRSSFATWSTRVTVNACLGFLRSNKIRKMASLDAIFDGPTGDDLRAAPSSELPDRELSPDQRVESKASDELVAAALASLDVDKRTVLVLRDVRGLDYAQIAEVLETSEGTVKSRLFRAREALAAAVSSLEARRPS